jgi:hypothetical protein
MNGPRILLIVGLAIAGMLYLAVSPDETAAIDRGLQESEAAFALVEEKLSELEPCYEFLAQQGLALNMREEHEGLRSKLATLRDQRVTLETDPALDSRNRLDLMRQLAGEADELSAWAIGLGHRLCARVDFMKASTPLLREARQLRDALARATPGDDELTVRIQNLASSFGEFEDRARLTVNLMKQNADQGAVMAGTVLSGLRTLIEDQQATLAEVNQDG